MHPFNASMALFVYTNGQAYTTHASHTISYMSVISLRFIRLFLAVDDGESMACGSNYQHNMFYWINYVRVCLANPTCSVGGLTFRCKIPLLSFLNSIFYLFLLIALSDISFQFDSKVLFHATCWCISSIPSDSLEIGRLFEMERYLI